MWNLVVPEVFLFDKLHLLERMHPQQLHKDLWGELFLVADVLEDYVEPQQDQQHTRNSELSIVDIS